MGQPDLRHFPLSRVLPRLAEKAPHQADPFPPSNIMLNAAGQVMVTDFGLAAVAKQLRGRDAGSGTPAYMAPEQLKGREVTKRSDIYSLGAVLYEMFTGRRAFDGGSRGDLKNPSSVTKDVDPAVERVILQCLATGPGDRPETPLAVAMALPGGDPLAAPLAAGETPSPEMVAAAGAEAGIGARGAVLCLAGMAAKAREIARSLGYKTRPDCQPLRERRSTPVYFW